jgi:hypothetical protein
VTTRPKPVLQPANALSSRTDQCVGTRRKPAVHRTSKHSRGEGTNYISAKYCLCLETAPRNSTRNNWGSTRLVLDLLSDVCEEALK